MDFVFCAENSVVLVQEKPVFDILSNKEHTQKKIRNKENKKGNEEENCFFIFLLSSTFELHWGSVWNCVMERQRCQLVEISANVRSLFK